MNTSTFYNKLNKVGSNVYPIEEEILMPSNHIYEAELQHDNINDSSVEVYTGTNLTGDPVGYTLTTPTETPWKRIIHVESSAEYIYITYETIGDQVEGDDINRLQNELIRTQNAVTELEAEVTGSIAGYTWNRLMGIRSEDLLEITTQPVSQTTTAGTEVSFSVVAQGVGLTYQWQYAEAGTSIWENFTSGNAATLSVTPTASWDGRLIRCILTNGAGTTAVTNTVTLTVT